VQFAERREERACSLCCSSSQYRTPDLRTRGVRRAECRDVKLPFRNLLNKFNTGDCDGRSGEALLSYTVEGITVRPAPTCDRPARELRGSTQGTLAGGRPLPRQTDAQESGSVASADPPPRTSAAEVQSHWPGPTVSLGARSDKQSLSPREAFAERAALPAVPRSSLCDLARGELRPGRSVIILRSCS
jgi:hypothetical protein